MSVWAISDLHLSFSSPEKSMEKFGEYWKGYLNKIETFWKNHVSFDDLVLLPGDLSWAVTLEKAKVDFDWVDQLPGTKLIIKGNHDYWWSSLKKLRSFLPSSIHPLYNNAFFWKGIGIGGTRLWESEEYTFDPYILYLPMPITSQEQKQEINIQKELSKKIFQRELERLKRSLSQIKKEAKVRIAMTHFPPIGCDLKESQTSRILQEFHIDTCVFGHLHSLKKKSLFGSSNSISYSLVSCDYLDFQLAKIL